MMVDSRQQTVDGEDKLKCRIENGGLSVVWASCRRDPGNAAILAALCGRDARVPTPFCGRDARATMDVNGRRSEPVAHFRLQRGLQIGNHEEA